MATLKIDLVDGADMEDRTERGVTSQRASRIALVHGLADGSHDAAATTLVRAQQLVEASYPRGTPYHPLKPQCCVVGYRNEGLADNSDAVRVRVFYATTDPGGGGGGGGGGSPWTIEDDAFIQETTTQIHPKTGKVLRVRWFNRGGPLQSAPPPPGNDGKPRLTIENIATLTYPEPIRRVVLTAVLPKARIKAIRPYVGGVNKSKFSSLKMGHWRFSRLRTSAYIGATHRRVTVELDGRVELDWAVEAICRDPRDGKFKANPTAAAELRKKPYEYGVQEGNGVIKVGFYPLISFSSLFGVNDVDDL